MTDVEVNNALDMSARITQLSLLRDGWLDGEGLALARDGLGWFANAWQSHWPSNLPLPHLYPTPTGGLEAEWMKGEMLLSAEIDLAARQATLLMVNLQNGDIAIDQTINLAVDDGWNTMAECLRAAKASL